MRGGGRPSLRPQLSPELLGTNKGHNAWYRQAKETRCGKTGGKTSEHLAVPLTQGTRRGFPNTTANFLLVSFLLHTLHILGILGTRKSVRTMQSGRRNMATGDAQMDAPFHCLVRRSLPDSTRLRQPVTPDSFRWQPRDNAGGTVNDRVVSWRTGNRGDCRVCPCPLCLHCPDLRIRTMRTNVRCE